MRTTADECAELGRRIASKLNQASGPIVLYIPLKGVSAIATEGGVFFDPQADRALIEALDTALAPHVEVHKMDMDINDPRFAQAMADHLHSLVCR
jgi:uncharacterized protein (UPF0261 family)